MHFVSLAYVVCTNDGRKDGNTGRIYLADSSYLQLREFPASSPSRHNRGGYWTGNGGRARPITAPAIFRPAPLKPGDSPRHIGHLLHRRPALYRLSAKTVTILGTRRADVRLAAERPPLRFAVFARSKQRRVYRWMVRATFPSHGR